MEHFEGIVHSILFHGGRRDNESYPHFLLTPRDYNGKNYFTVGKLKQRRFLHRTIQSSDDEVPNQEILAEGFFFAV